MPDLAPRLVEGEGSEQSARLPGLHFLGSKAELMCLLGEKSSSRCLSGHIARRAAICRLIAPGILGAARAYIRSGGLGNPLHRSDYTFCGITEPFIELW